MKVKVTLTVKKSIADKARQIAASRGVSLSQLFEEIFEKETLALEPSESQLAAARFLQRLKEMKSIQATDESDREAWRRYLREKYQ